MERQALLAKAAARVDALGTALPATIDRDELVRAVAISDFLGDALTADPGLLARLAVPAYVDPVPGIRALLAADVAEAEFGAQLRRLRRAVMADIAWRDLSGRFTLDETLAAVSGLADAAIEAALAQASRAVAARYGHVRADDGNPLPLVVVGMGKLGGRELNFSSDVDLVFLYPESRDSDGRVSLDAADYYRRIGQALIRLLDAATVDGYVFRVDMRLRPFGDSGPLVVSFAALEDYLLSHGRDWERYAWVKARAITGQAAYESLFREAVRPFVYRRYLDFGVFESLREMKAMISREVARRDLADDVKLGQGGIREVEFVAQAFQLLRGGSDVRLQTTSLLAALARLPSQKLLPAAVVEELTLAYRHLRTVENRLQMLADQQTHQLPTDPGQRDRLALAMGDACYGDMVERLNVHRARVSEHFHAFVHAPDGAAPVGLDLSALWVQGSDAGTLAASLAEQGVREAAAVSELLIGFAQGASARRLDEAGARRLARLLPSIVQRAGNQAEPARTLRRALDVLQAIGGRSSYLALLHESPLACERLIEVCALGDFLPAQISAHPLLLDELVDQRLLDEPPSRAHFEEELAVKVAAAEGDSEREADGLRVFQRAAVFRTALFDLTGRLPLMQVSDRLTDVAELILERAIEIAWRDLTAIYGEPIVGVGEDRRVCGIAAIGYGKFGGHELGYGSDLDLVFLHDSTGDAQHTSGPKVVEHGVFYLRLGQRILHLLTMHAAGGRLYDVDTRLRPSGKGGPMVSNILAFADYQRSEAWTWEHQALLHSRAVAGSASLRAAFEDVRADVLCRHVRRDRLREDVRDMRARMRRELGSHDEDSFDIKRDPGGVADIEFLAQYWVLRFADRDPALVTFADTIRQLESVGSAALVDHAHIDTLVDAYRAYRAVTHHLSLEARPAVVPSGALGGPRAAVRALWDRYLGAADEPAYGPIPAVPDRTRPAGRL